MAFTPALAAIFLMVSCGNDGDLDVVATASVGAIEGETTETVGTDGSVLTRQGSSELSDVQDVDSALAFSLATASRYTDRELTVELSADQIALGEEFTERFEQLHNMKFAQNPLLFSNEAWLSVARPVEGAFIPPRGLPGGSFDGAEGRVLLSIFDPATSEQHVGLYRPEDLERLIGRSIKDLEFVLAVT